MLCLRTWRKIKLFRVKEDLENERYLEERGEMLNYSQKISDVNIPDVLFRTFNFRTLLILFQTT